MTVKKNLKVDWTEPHREDVKADLRAAVRRVLRRRGVKEEDFDPFLARIMEQAEALYGDNYWIMTGTVGGHGRAARIKLDLQVGQL